MKEEVYWCSCCAPPRKTEIYRCCERSVQRHCQKVWEAKVTKFSPWDIESPSYWTFRTQPSLHLTEEKKKKEKQVWSEWQPPANTQTSSSSCAPVKRGLGFSGLQSWQLSDAQKAKKRNVTSFRDTVAMETHNGTATVIWEGTVRANLEGLINEWQQNPIKHHSELNPREETHWLYWEGGGHMNWLYYSPFDWLQLTWQI